MAVDPLTGQTSLNSFAGFMDPDQMGQILAGQAQAGTQGQLAQALMGRGYIPNSGFGGALAQMVQAAIGMKMLQNSQSSLADLSSQKIAAENKAEQAKHAQEQQDKQADVTRAISQATGIDEAKIKLALQYGPQQSAQATAAKVAEQAALEPGEVKKAGDIAGAQLPFEIKKAYATAGAGEQAKMAQLQQAMAMPEGPEKSARMTLLLGANAPMVGMMGAGGGGQSGVTGPDFLKTLDPNIGNQVKALAEGRMQFPSGFALKTPYWQTMLSAVSQYDPSFDASNFGARSKLRADVTSTSGKAGQSIAAINTAIGHAGRLADQAAQLNNFSGMATPLNQLVNTVENRAGDPRMASFDQTRNALAEELERAWRGTGGSEAGIKAWKDTINNAQSPEQLKSAIGNAMELLGSRLDSLQSQYKETMGPEAKPEFLNDKSKAILQKMQQGGFNIGGSLSAESGGSPAGAGAPTQTAINPKTGQRIGLVNGQWVPMP